MSGYSKLMYFLIDIPFEWSHELDSKLIDNVKNYRWSHGYVGMDPVSVFEVLALLAFDAERKIMHQTGAGNRTSNWFWMMMNNLGLQIFDDERWNSRSKGTILRIVKRFMAREYRADGRGGPFYIDDLKGRDLRKEALWTQMTWFLGEKYDYEWKIEVI